MSVDACTPRARARPTSRPNDRHLRRPARAIGSPPFEPCSATSGRPNPTASATDSSTSPTPQAPAQQHQRSPNDQPPAPPPSGRRGHVHDPAPSPRACHRHARRQPLASQPPLSAAQPSITRSQPPKQRPAEPALNLKAQQPSAHYYPAASGVSQPRCLLGCLSGGAGKSAASARGSESERELRIVGSAPTTGCRRRCRAARLENEHAVDDRLGHRLSRGRGDGVPRVQQAEVEPASAAAMIVVDGLVATQPAAQHQLRSWKRSRPAQPQQTAGASSRLRSARSSMSEHAARRPWLDVARTCRSYRSPAQARQPPSAAGRWKAPLLGCCDVRAFPSHKHGQGVRQRKRPYSVFRAGP